MRARATRPVAHVVVLVVVILALVAVPVAARPYGAKGRTGEVRYDVAPAKPNCVRMEDNAGRTMPLCFHRTTSGAHRTSATWFKAAISAFKTSWNQEVRVRGFRRPLLDGGAAKNQGPNRGLDIYLADIGDDGTFGYCTNDPGVTGERRPAYCVIDNDFAEFGGTATARLRELRGTAAHEFFHTVHYAYDRSIPAWLSEGSALWMEDQVFDSGNTNRRYLDITALRQPEDPFDRSGTGYGAWLFWQFLAEEYGRDTVRSVWNRVAADTGTEDVFAAIAPDVREKFGRVLATFGAWNYAVGSEWSYVEGDGYRSALGGKKPPLDASHTLTATRLDTDMTGSDAPREITAEPRSVHYVRITAEVARNVVVEVNRAGSSSWMVQTGPGQFTEPTAFGSGAAQISLQAGQSALLVLTNTAAREVALTYRAEAQP